MQHRTLLTVALACSLALPPATSRAASAVHSELEAAKPSVLVGKHLQTGTLGYSFSSESQVSYMGGGYAGQGTWSQQGKGIRIEGELGGGPQNVSSPFEVTWLELHASSSGLIVLTQESESDSLLRDVFECEGAVCGTGPSSVVQVRPAASDRALFEAVLPLVGEAASAAVVKGSPASNPRQHSEIWYVPPFDEAEGAAQRLAENLADRLGPIAPQPWTWGTPPYEVILVVGAEKVGGSAGDDESAPSAEDLLRSVRKVCGDIEKGIDGLRREERVIEPTNPQNWWTKRSFVGWQDGPRLVKLQESYADEGASGEWNYYFDGQDQLVFLFIDAWEETPEESTHTETRIYFHQGSIFKALSKSGSERDLGAVANETDSRIMGDVGRQSKEYVDKAHEARSAYLEQAH